MKVFVVLTVLLGLALADEDIFDCYSEDLINAGADVVKISNEGQTRIGFKLTLSDHPASLPDETLTRNGGQPIKLKLSEQRVQGNMPFNISSFLIKAFIPLDRNSTVSGSWDYTDFEAAACGVKWESNGKQMEEFTLQFNYTGSQDLRFEAAVITTNNVVFVGVLSPFIKIKNPHDVESEVTEQKPDPHTDPTEFIEKPADKENEEEEQKNDEQQEQPIPEENPSEDEDQQEKDRQETLEHDIDVHDPRVEEQKAIEKQKQKQQAIAEEERQSEADWMKERMELLAKEEEELHQEMMAYERLQAEEEKKRLELIQWEIRDKEEHDKIMADEEAKRKEQAEKEKEANKTPKEDKPDTEVEVHEDILIIKEEQASTGGAASVVATLSLFITALFMMM